MQYLRAGCKLKSLHWIFIPMHRELVWELLALFIGYIYVSLCNAVKTSMSPMHLKFNFFRWEQAIPVKQHIKSAMCYMLFFEFLTKHLSSHSPLFSIHHIKHFQQKLHIIKEASDQEMKGAEDQSHLSTRENPLINSSALTMYYYSPSFVSLQQPNAKNTTLLFQKVYSLAEFSRLLEFCYCLY